MGQGPVSDKLVDANMLKDKDKTMEQTCGPTKASPRGKENMTENDGATNQQKKGGPGRFVPVILIIAGFVAFFALGGQDYLTFEALKEHRHAILDWRSANPVLAPVTFIIGYALVVAFSLPGAVWMTLAGGFIFGTWGATLYVIVGATIGAVGIFLAARYAFADFFHAKAGKAIQKMEAGFQEDALSYMLVLRLVPLFPFWLVNLVPAFLGVPLRTYIIGTFIGIIPGSFVYCLAGNGLGAVFEQGGTPDLSIIFQPEIIAPIIGLAVLSMIPVAYKKMKKKGTANEQ